MQELNSKSGSATKSLDPDLYEKFLAITAILLLVLVSLALFQGRTAWVEIPSIVSWHLVTVLLALAITPFQLLMRRGGRWHRWLGWIWAVSLFGTAAISLAIGGFSDGRFSLIHILSVITLISVPLVVQAARRRRIAKHRQHVRNLVTGALLIAGFFTLLPSRILGGWLWG